MNRWWKPIGTEMTMSIMNAIRPISSLNSRPPAALGSKVYMAMYAGNSQKYTMA